VKRYLLSIVNAITELTEVLRFGLEDVMGRFEDIEDLLYMTTIGKTDDQLEDQLLVEYNYGWEDGYRAAEVEFDELRPQKTSLPVLNLNELNTELYDALFGEDEEEAEDEEFNYLYSFAT